MYDKCILQAKNAAETHHAGRSLADTLYGTPVTVAMTGELGAGKTAFLQGFASALGIQESITSPTYALEQRYQTPKGELLHLDLYRLTPAQSHELLRASEDFQGIRCIEWSERVNLERMIAQDRVIHIHLEENAKKDERTIHCAFHDAALIPDGGIERWREEVRLPSHIAAHCEAVATFCRTLAERLIGDGHLVRTKLLTDAARAHDLLRFIDFRPGGHPDVQPQELLTHWDRYRHRYAGKHHEEACAVWLREHGYPEIAEIVAVHGLQLPSPERATIEQKLLFYADKRMMIDKTVTLEERFADFAMRYGDAKAVEGKIWLEESRRIENELFPDGALPR